MSTSTASPANINQRWLLRTAFGALLMAALLFVPAGTLRWGMGWFYVLSLALVGVASAVWLDPALLEERMTRHPGEQKAWDKVLFPIYGLVNGLLVPVTAGLEYRFNWLPDLPAWLVWGAVAVYLLGWVIGIWAMHCNQFFAQVARLQPERGQTVASGGPYAWVRHPGYLSGSLTLFTTALLLGSFWACLPALLGVGVLVARTALEDRMLIDELPGYEAYTRQTRYRLLPGVW